MDQTYVTSKHIIIVGAGLGGLCLAQGLKKAGISFSVYERDPSPAARSQGYRLRITGDAVDVLENHLTTDLWTLFENTCAISSSAGQHFDAITSLPKQGGQVGPPPGMVPGRVYTVDRYCFRGVLMTGIDVHFGKDFKRYSTLPNGKIRVEFEDGTVEEGDLLVGADGRGSKIRRQYLPDHANYDLDVRAIYGKTVFTPELTQIFPADLLEHFTLLSDSNATLFLDPVRFKVDPAIASNGILNTVHDYVYWVLLVRSSTLGMTDQELYSLSKDKFKDLTLQLSKSWKPEYRSIFELQSSDQTAAILISSAHPDRPAWQSSNNVTVIGDSIHAMLPTGAQGANTALRDAGKLCEIIKNGPEIDIAKFEKEMREYSNVAIERSYGAGRKFGCVSFEESKRLE